MWCPARRLLTGPQNIRLLLVAYLFLERCRRRIRRWFHLSSVWWRSLGRKAFHSILTCDAILCGQGASGHIVCISQPFCPLIRLRWWWFPSFVRDNLGLVAPSSFYLQPFLRFSWELWLRRWVVPFYRVGRLSFYFDPNDFDVWCPRLGWVSCKRSRAEGRTG